MITLNKIGDYHNRQVLEIECLKADEKPIGTIDGLVITNGSKLHELDGSTYEYDEQNKTWVLQPKSSGGADGREIELQKTQTHIQWRYVGTEEWFDLVSLDEISFKHSDFTPEQLQALKGAKGDKGNPGTNGANGKDGLSIKSTQINDSGHLILTFSDESTKDVGKVTGENGESAYQIAIRLGFRGTEQEWIESLKYDHSEEFTKLAAEVRNTASNIAAERQQITQNKTDVTQLNEDLTDLDNFCENNIKKIVTKNLINGLDSSQIKKGSYLDENTGNELNASGHVIFERYVQVEPDTSYSLWDDIGSQGVMHVSNERVRIILYDSSKKFIKGYRTGENIATTSETRYIRVSMPEDYFNRSILKKGIEQPDAKHIPFTENLFLTDELSCNTKKAIVRPEILRDDLGKYLPIACFCQNYSIEDGFSAPIYALSVRDYVNKCQILFRSLDGGITWDKKGNIPINIENGEIITTIYVEPWQETLYVIKNLGTAGGDNNKLISYDISNTEFMILGELDIQKKYAHAYSHNFESAFLLDTNTPYTIFAEYGTGNDEEMYVWRTKDKGKNWEKVFVQGARGGNGQIKHFHCIQYDPYRKELWLASGDTDTESKIWISKDDGNNWDLKYSGSQKTRTLGFVFEKDAIYYGMDSPQPESPSHLYKIVRNTVSLAPTDNIIDLGTSQNGWAIYNLTKMIIPSGILIFTVYERANSSIPNNKYRLEFFDYSKQKIITIGEFDITRETGGYVGVMYAPRYQDMISGKVFFSSIINLFGVCSEVPKSIYSPTYSLSMTI